MKRVVFSLYIDIPKEDLDWQPPHHGHTTPKTEHTKTEFQKNWKWLTERQKNYCETIDVEYKLFEYDEKYMSYRDWFLAEYPQITHYNIVNFYKIHLMYELAKDYDEILYLDLDVVPLTTDNFFEAFDLQKEVAIMEGLAPSQSPFPKNVIDLYKQCSKHSPSIRSPCAKYWNAIAMDGLMDFESETNLVFNTGIVGISKKHLEQLDYFGDFHEILKLMDDIKEDDFWPKPIRDIFGWDNETIWTYKNKLNDVPWTLLGGQWHHFMDKDDFIPKDAKFAHVITKHFDFVKEWIKENVEV